MQCPYVLPDKYGDGSSQCCAEDAGHLEHHRLHWEKHHGLPGKDSRWSLPDSYYERQEEREQIANFVEECSGMSAGEIAAKIRSGEYA